jgi:hypothetical protein
MRGRTKTPNTPLLTKIATITKETPLTIREAEYNNPIP